MDYLIKRDDLRDCHWADAPVTGLADGMARLRVDAFALTANNVTYATFGEAMKYWDFFPASSPEFGRVPVWGFATIIESKAAGVDVGSRVYGYLPISDTVDVQPVRVGKESFMDGVPHRRDLAPKTAMALAHCLKARGVVEAVALTSPGNVAYVESTGLYARTQTYDQVDRMHARGLTAFVDFLGRPSLTADVHNALKDRLVRSLVIGVTDWEGNRAPISLPDPQPEFFFVPTYAAERAKVLGADVLNKRLGTSLMSFYRASSAFVTPQEESGMDSIDTAWHDTLEGKVSPATGLVLSF